MQKDIIEKSYEKIQHFHKRGHMSSESTHVKIIYLANHQVKCPTK